MAKSKLNDEQVGKISALIYGWRRKPFRWELIVDRVKTDFDIEVTRQTLSDKKYPEIQHAYKLKKQALRDKPKEDVISLTKSDKSLYEQLVEARAKTEKLEAKIETLETQSNHFLALINAIKENAKSNPMLLQLLNDITRELGR